MKCSQFQQLIDAYLDEELSSNLRLEFDTHRVQCDNCQRWLTMVEAVTNTVRDDRDVPALSTDFTARVLASTSESENPRPRQQVWRLWTAGAAAMQAAAVLVWVMLQPAAPTAAPVSQSNKAQPVPLTALTPVDIAAVTLDNKTEFVAANDVDEATFELSPLNEELLSDQMAAVASQDKVALLEIILSQLELQVEQVHYAGRRVSGQTQQLMNYLHFSLPVDDASDTFCEAPTVDPFTGLLEAVSVLAEDESPAEQIEAADDRFQL